MDFRWDLQTGVSSGLLAAPVQRGLEAEVLQGAPLQPPQPPLPVSLNCTALLCTALHCTGCIYLFCVAMQLSIRGDSARQFH